MRHHLHIWLFYLNKLWNRFCLVLRGKKPLGFCLFYCNVPECISKMESLRDWGCMCVCMVFKEEGQTSNITPASKSRYHLQMCDGLYIYDLTAIKKKLKTNLFIERFTASSQPCNFFKKNLFFLSFFLAKYLLWLGTDAHPVILLSTRRPFVRFTWAISISAHPL